MKLTFLKTNFLKVFSFRNGNILKDVLFFVKITASNGQFGLGEGYGSAKVLEEGIKLLTPHVVGQNPLENEVIWNHMYRKTLDFARRGILVASMSAIDIAIWDLKEKILGLSVSTF